ncbi:MAG TPA: hypothetical protein V6C69_18005 [Trichormus sp.]|jgi:poly(3-hydroxybutyrate) depolymerase
MPPDVDEQHYVTPQGSTEHVTRLQAGGIAKVGERPQAAGTLDTARLPALTLDQAFHFDKPPEPGSTVRATMQIDGQPRDLYLHIPPNYDPNKPAGLILCLNGLGEGAKGQESFTQLSAAGDKSNYILAYPDGSGKGTWYVPNSAHGWNNGQDPGDTADDPKFLNTLIDHLQSGLSIDPKKVFMVGQSSGGSGVDSTISQMHGRVAAVADIQGWTTGHEHPLTTPTSALIIKGLDNPLSPDAGSNGQTWAGVKRFFSGNFGSGAAETVLGAVGPSMQPTQATANYYARADHTQNVQRFDNGQMHVTRYTGGTNATEVEVIRGDHLGNGWPGSTYPDPYMIDAQGRQVGATDTIIDFFNHHAKQQ